VEEALAVSETKYRKLFDEMSNGSALHQIICDDGGNPVDYITLDVNAAFESLLGVKRDQVIGKKASETLPPEELKNWTTIFGYTALTGISRRYEMYSPLNEKYFEGVVFSTEPGKFAITFSDITERKQAEEALRRSEEQYRLLFENAPVGILSATVGGQITEVNAAALRILGSPSAKATKNVNMLTFPPLVETGISADFLACVENSQTVSAERLYTTKWGKSIFIKYQLTPVLSAPGKIKLVQAIIEDISEQKQAEAALLESSARFRTLFEASPDAVMLVDPQGNWPILDCNTAACKMNGYTREELIGQSIDMINIEPGDKAERQEYLDAIQRAGVLRKESLHRRKDGSVFPIEISTCMFTLDERQVVLGIDRDITERKRAEAAIQRRNAELTVLNQIGQALNKLAKPAEILELVFEGIGQVLDNRNLYIALFDETDQMIHFPVYLIHGERIIGRERPLSNGITDYILRHNTPVFFTRDIAESLNQLGIERIGIPSRSFLGVPMRAGDKVIGVIAVQDYEQEDVYDEHHLELLTTIAAQATVALENARLYSAVQVELEERRQTELALRESETRYRSLFEDSPISLWEEDFSAVKKRLEGLRQAGIIDFYAYFKDHPQFVAECASLVKIVDVNKATLEIYQAKRKEELIKNLPTIFTDESYDEFAEELKHILRGDTQFGWEGTNRTVKGERLDVSLTWSVVPGHEDDLSRVIVSVTDITERKRAEEAIRSSEKKFKTLFEIAPVGISVLDRQQNVIDVNYSLQMITGLKRKELLNGSYRKRTYLRPDGTVMPPGEFASTRALEENMPIFDVETGIVTDDRGVVWTQVSAAPLDRPDASLVVVTQDVSERKLSELTLRQRLAELETLYESGLSLSRLLEPKEIGQKIIDVLSEKLDWNHTTIRQYHPESNELELLAYNIAGNLSDEEWQKFGERFRTLIARPGDGMSGWALQHRETVRCGDLLKDPRYVETVPGLRSGLYVPIQAGERAIGVISVESDKLDYFTPEDEHLAVTLAAQAAVALENIRLFKDLQRSNDGLLRAYDDTIEGWSHALDLRDKETEGHTQRVTKLTEELAREMGIPDSELIYIRWGALLHDIGKMGVPDRILLKPDKLTDDDWVIMRQHPVQAYNLLSRIDYLQPAINIPHYHHERWDGSGYPDGLHGEDIPLEARIFAVVDVFDALTSDRPYRPAWPRDKALRYIHDQAGYYFDPLVVEVFLKLINGK
jgi:PAS domain S-box-containing protein/putative nucleotidyltransferase with HDIG domain